MAALFNQIPALSNVLNSPKIFGNVLTFGSRDILRMKHTPIEISKVKRPHPHAGKNYPRNKTAFTPLKNDGQKTVEVALEKSVCQVKRRTHKIKDAARFHERRSQRQFDILGFGSSAICCSGV